MSTPLTRLISSLRPTPPNLQVHRIKYAFDHTNQDGTHVANVFGAVNAQYANHKAIQKNRLQEFAHNSLAATR